MDHDYFGSVDFMFFGGGTEQILGGAHCDCVFISRRKYSGLLLLSSLIGIFSACQGKNEQTTENYYFGNRRMSPIPVGLSLGVSFISAVTVIGGPVESYLFGAVLSWMSVGFAIGLAFTSVYFVPLVYRLNISSIYEYLEMRFDRRVRVFCSSLTVLQMVFYMGVCIYVPALALSAVTPLEMKWTIILTSLVCTFYTSLGGFKAVVWTDSLQAAIMFIGSLALCIQGTILVGGSSKVWNAAIRGERLNVFKVSFDPTVRISVLHCIIGQSVMTMALTCSNQAMVQRIMSCRSQAIARRALFFCLVPVAVISTLAVCNGLVMYAYYENCDPLLSHIIKKPDQMIPKMMTKAFFEVPGLAGIFVAAACSGTLSTVSSGINSLSVVIVEDFATLLKKSLSPKQKLWGGRLCGAFLGCLVTLIAFIAGSLGSTVIQIASSLIGGFGGPIFGIFVSGIFIPRTTAKGALAGLTISTIMSLWIISGAAVYKANPAKQHYLYRSVSNCSVDDTLPPSDWNVTTLSPIMEAVTNETIVTREERSLLADSLYSISYFYVCMFGAAVSIIVASLVSMLSGPNDPKDIDPLLFVPLVDNKRLPAKIREFFRFGVPDAKKIVEYEEFEHVAVKNDDLLL